ncbi:Endoglucanase [Diplonema papillatum]|nr:Endoglucanase [Diplonema papillatum]
MLRLCSLAALAAVSVAVDAPTHPRSTVSLPLSTNGGKIVDTNGANVKLSCVTWPGGEDWLMVPRGLEYNIIDRIIILVGDMGFNCVRLPFSLELVDTKPVLPVDGDESKLAWEKRFIGGSAMDVFDAVVRALTRRGILVILENLASAAGEEGGLWYTDAYPEEKWISLWEEVVTRYARIPGVIGCGLRGGLSTGIINSANVEPTWGSGNADSDWRLAAIKAIGRLQAIRADLLMFVSGIDGGENLKDVRDHLISNGDLMVGNKVVYEAFNFPSSNTPTTSFEDFSARLLEDWAYIMLTDNSAPVFLGAFGASHTDAGLDSLYWQFLSRWLSENEVSWSWSHLAGTYNGRNTSLMPYGSEDPTGLLNMTYTGPAEPRLVQELQALMDKTYWVKLLPTHPRTKVTLPLSTEGTKIVDANGDTVKLSCVTWPGAEGAEFTPEGLNSNSIDNIVAMVVDWGFNCVRLPFSLQSVETNPPIADLLFEPGLKGTNASNATDAVIDSLTQKGLMVILQNQDDESGAWYDDSYDEEAWISLWEEMLTRYANEKLVIGCGLRNSLSAATVNGIAVNPEWGTGDEANDWRLAAIKAIDRLHKIRSDVLMFVSGIEGAVNLKGVRDHPISNSDVWINNKVVYEAHDLATSSASFEDFSARFLEDWAFIMLEDNSTFNAPVFLGEFGITHSDAGLGTVWWQFISRWLSEHEEVSWSYSSLPGTLNGNENPEGLLNVAYSGPASRRQIRDLQAIMPKTYWAPIQQGHALMKAAVPLRTEGVQIVDANGKKVTLSCASWPGAEKSLMTPQGLEYNTIAGIAKIVADWGFTCVRLPFSLELVDTNPLLPIGGDESKFAAEPSFLGKHALDVFDAVVKTLTRRGIMVILENRLSDAGYCCSNDNGNGLWYTESYPEDRWLSLWEDMMTRYKRNKLVVGCVLRSELRTATVNSATVAPTWGSGNADSDWRLAAIKAIKRLQAVRSDLLMFVSGIDGGENLKDVRDHPITTDDADTLGNRVVYEAHNFPSSNIPTTSFEDFSARLLQDFAYIMLEDNSAFNAPVILGEFGTAHTDAGLDDVWWEFLSRWLSENQVSWSWSPLVGTMYGSSDRPYGDEEPNGLLNTTYTGPASTRLVQELQALMDKTYWIPAGATHPDTTVATPLSVVGSKVIDANGKPVKLSCVNWPGAQEHIFVPLGLEYNTIDGIVDLMVEWGLNCVRLQFSLELVDKNPVPLDHLLAKEPSLQGRPALETYDAVVESLTRKGIMVLLDNHNSDAAWCCGRTDGNGMWYTETYSEDSWISLWEVMVRRFMDNDYVIGCSMRNEPRWATVYGEYMKVSWGDKNLKTDWRTGALNAINRLQTVAPHFLYSIPGIEYSKDLKDIRDHPILDTDVLIPHKRMYEAHLYAWVGTVESPELFLEDHTRQWAFVFMDEDADYVAPIFVGEFGMEHMNDKLVEPWWTLLHPFMAKHDIGWAWWSMSATMGGSPGRPYGGEETYGLPNTTWDGPANERLISSLQALMDKDYWPEVKQIVVPDPPLMLTPAPNAPTTPIVKLTPTAFFTFDETLDDSVNTSDAARFIMKSVNDEDGNRLSYDAYYNTEIPATPSYSTDAISGHSIYCNGTVGMRFRQLVSSDEYSFALWLKPQKKDIHSPAVFWGNADTWINLMPRWWSQYGILWSRAGFNTVYDTLVEIPMMEWTHFAVSVRKGAVSVMLNGTEVVNAIGQRDIFTNVEPKSLFTLGLNYWDLPFTGWFDDFVVYDTALTVAEVRMSLIEQRGEAEVAAFLQSDGNLCLRGTVGRYLTEKKVRPGPLFGQSYAWASSNESVFSNNGLAAPPQSTADRLPVELTLTVQFSASNSIHVFEDMFVISNVPVAAFTFDCQSLEDMIGDFNTAKSIETDGTDGGSVSYGTGVYGHSLYLDGETGVRLPDDLVGDNYTVAFWVKRQSTTEETTLWYGYKGNDWCRFRVSDIGAGALRCGNTSAEPTFEFAIPDFQLPVATWTHIAFTFEDNTATVSLFVNGAFVGNMTDMPQLFAGGSSALGVNNTEADAFKGWIDEVLVFNTALTAAELNVFLWAETEKPAESAPQLFISLSLLVAGVVLTVF